MGCYSFRVYSAAYEVASRLARSSDEMVSSVFIGVAPKIRRMYQRVCRRIFSRSDYPALVQLLNRWE